MGKSERRCRPPAAAGLALLYFKKKVALESRVHVGNRDGWGPDGDSRKSGVTSVSAVVADVQPPAATCSLSCRKATGEAPGDPAPLALLPHRVAGIRGQTSGYKRLSLPRPL